MKALRKIGILVAAVAITAIGIGCRNTVEVEKEKTYASAVTFKAEDVGEAGVKITMTTATEDATIFYTTDGTEPSARSNKYSMPLTFNKDVEIRAVAVKRGIENSPVSVGKVSIKTKTVEVDKKADETAPAAVTNLAASAKDRRVLLTWTDAADSDVYGYEVSYSGTAPINRVVLPALNSTSMMVAQGAGGCYVSGLTNGTEYTFTVKTVDTSGNRSEGVSAKATPLAANANSPSELPDDNRFERATCRHEHKS